MPAPPFRLLAISPPEGPIDAALVDHWAAAGGLDLGLGVLLRQPDTDLSGLLSAIRRGRLSALASRCRALGIPLQLSLAAEQIRDFERMRRSEGAIDEFTGIQLRADPCPRDLQRIRRTLSRACIGRSCHGHAAGTHDLVDYTCVAPIYPPTTAQRSRVKSAIGLAPLRDWAAQPGARIFALGGVRPGNAEKCLQAGAWGLAGIGLFFGDPRRVGEDVAAVTKIFARHPSDVRFLPL
ncbi:MAG TPA: thiamine phosphate synthase [Nannocystis exedens]|nr:thiamine phosphate synthase [Nannocystis exedens]